MYSDKENCMECPDIRRCCEKQGYRVIRRHIKEELNEEFRNNRISPEGKDLYKMRKEKIERSFADSKQNHGYRYAMYKGIKKNQNYTWLICATQNMKNIVTKVTKQRKLSGDTPPSSGKFIKNSRIYLTITFLILLHEKPRKTLNFFLGFVNTLNTSS